MKGCQTNFISSKQTAAHSLHVLCVFLLEFLEGLSEELHAFRQHLQFLLHVLDGHLSLLGDVSHGGLWLWSRCRRLRRCRRCRRLRHGSPRDGRRSSLDGGSGVDLDGMVLCGGKDGVSRLQRAKNGVFILSAAPLLVGERGNSRESGRVDVGLVSLEFARQLGGRGRKRLR